MFGAVCGTSTTTAYIESVAGIASGGRSGLTAVTTGLLLLATMFIVPLLAIVPSFATAPALIMVGYFMMRNISRIDLSNMETAFPCYIIMTLIALSYSISTGLAFGFLSYSLIKIARGKWREIKPTLWLINALCLIFFMV
jgi:AGZA family xanthine/uracil permease-like MFS transporter